MKYNNEIRNELRTFIKEKMKEFKLATLLATRGA